MLWLTVNAPGGRSAILGATYRPPTEPVMSDIDALRQQLLEASGHGKPVLLLSDLNIDLSRPNKPHAARLTAMLQELSFAQLIRDPTHPGVNPSLIDHVITNEINIGPSAADVVKARVSDHDLITVKMPLPRPRRTPRSIVTRSLRNVDYSALCLDLLYSDWSSLYPDEATPVDDLYAAFLDTWSAAVDRHCPLKTVKLRHLDRPWLTLNDDLLHLQARRDAARRARDAARTVNSDQAYLSLKRQFKQEISRARREYFSKSASSTEMWSELRKHALSSGGSRARGDVPDSATADAFNAYFAGVGCRIAAELAGRQSSPLPPRPPTVPRSTFTVRPATLPELSAALRRMNNSRGHGLRWRAAAVD